MIDSLWHTKLSSNSMYPFAGQKEGKEQSIMASNKNTVIRK